MTKKNVVLVIDDDQGIRESLCILLKSRGLDVHGAADGAEGVSLFRKIRPDLVICDLNMPGQHGYQTITEIKRMDLEVRIIAMSGGTPRTGGGRGQVGTTPEAMLAWSARFGADRVFVKPFEPSELLNEVFEMLPEAKAE